MSITEITALAAREIKCAPGAVWAVAYVESSLGEHLFRFEPHLFRRETGKAVRTYKAAVRIDAEAAARCCSIGVFQVLGRWHQYLGYETAKAMMTALGDAANIEAQAKSIALFCRDVAPAAGSALRALDASAFALSYNGPKALERGYHLKLKKALKRAGLTSSRILRRGAAGDAVRQLQKLLGVEVDGFFGENTEHALRDFQRAKGLKVDGVAGRKTWAALNHDDAPDALDPLDGFENVERIIRTAPGRILSVLGTLSTVAGAIGWDWGAERFARAARGDWGWIGDALAGGWLWALALAGLALGAWFFITAIRIYRHERRIERTPPADRPEPERRASVDGTEPLRPVGSGSGGGGTDDHADDPPHSSGGAGRGGQVRVLSDARDRYADLLRRSRLG